jgi:hypothetical protein
LLDGRRRLIALRLFRQRLFERGAALEIGEKLLKERGALGAAGGLDFAHNRLVKRRRCWR